MLNIFSKQPIYRNNLDTDSPDYKATLHQHQYKVMRDSDNYEEEKYRKDAQFEVFKEKRRTGDNTGSMQKKSRVPAPRGGQA